MNMKRTLLTASILAALSSQAMAAPGAPAFDMWGSNNLQFSKVQLAMDATAGYKSMVSYNDEAVIDIKFNQWSGDTGDTYNVYLDDELVGSGPITGSSTTASFTYSKGGVYDVVIEACDANGCTSSTTEKLTLADTDGAHLAPLTMSIDPNNKSYDTDKSKVVGSYFVEWSIYDRKYYVDNIPADNLTHLLYGFIPICGPNESLKSVGGNSFAALQTACQGSEDFEVVIHDPWAAYQKGFTQAGHEHNTSIKGNFGMLMALKQRNPDLKILPSVGGWTLSDPFFSFTEKSARDVFVNSVKEFLITWKFFDGVDIDWEFPGGGGENPNLGDKVKDGPAYVALMQELRVMLDDLEAETGRDYELTSAINVGHDKLAVVDYAAAVEHMDYIFGMSYDFYGAWSNVLGHQTGLYCGSSLAPGQCDGTGESFSGPAYTVANGIDILLAQGVPADKLVVGAAKYGRGWNGVMPSSLTDPSDPMTGVGNGKLTGTTEQGVWEAGVIDYKGIKEYMLGADDTGINGFKPGYDEQAQAAYIWNSTSGQLVTYDSPRSVKSKGAYVTTLGLAGLFSWEIDADNGDILNAMHEGLDGSTIELPPIECEDGSKVDNIEDCPIIEAPIVCEDGSKVDSIEDCPIIEAPIVCEDGSKVENIEDCPVVEAPIVCEDGSTVENIEDCPVIEEPNVPTFTPGETVVSNGDVVFHQGVCYEAKNNPGVWETPSANSWFWSVVDCPNEGPVNPPVDPENPPVDPENPPVDPENPPVDPENPPVDSTWDATKEYTAGDTVTIDGITYEAKWWTLGENPTGSGEWGVWKKV